MSEKIIPIPARLKNVSRGGHVAGAEDIIDDSLQKTLAELNLETNAAIEALYGDTIIIVSELPASGVTGKIYRVPGTGSYTDYMWDASLTPAAFVELATYTGGSEGDFFNVNAYNNVLTTPYQNAAEARGYVPSGVRKLGLLITYLLAGGWFTDQYIGTATDSTSWATASNWKTIGPVSVSQNTSTGHTDITVGGTTTPVASLYDLGYLTYSKATTAPYGDLALGFAFEIGKDYLFVNKSDSVSVNVYNGETLITTMNVGSQYLYHATANENAVIATGATGTMNFEVHCNLEKRVLDNENNIAELQSDSNKVLNHIMESHSYNVTAGTGKTVHGTKTLTNGKQYQIIFNEGADLISTLVVFNTAYTTYVAIPISSDKVAFTANFDGAFDLTLNSGAVVGTGTLDYDIIDNPFTLENKVDDNARGIETLEDSKANAVKSKNLLNPDTLNVGHFYWNYGDETTIGDSVNYAITDFIPINGHNIKANWEISGGMANCVFDANKTFLRKITTNDYEYQSGDAYIRYTTVSNPKNRQYQLEYGSASTPYEPYTDKLDVYQLSQEYTDNEIGKVKGIDIIVKKDGTGDYTSVVDAVNYANSLSSDGVVRNIHIYEGEYDILEELGGQTWLDNHTTIYGLSGLFPKNNVNLIGHGLVILKTILPTTINQSQGEAISGLSLSHYNNRIENIVVVAQNTRYACHDESEGYGDEITRVVKNCTFILLPRTAEHAWQYMTAYGGGTTVGGATYDFINCRFMSSTGNAWSFHTNEGAKPMYFNVDGCFGYCSGDLSFRASYYSTDQVGTTFFNIKNCTGNGGVEKRAETAQSTDHIVLLNNGYQSITSEVAEAIYDQIVDSLNLSE